jgi:Trypsin-like peptidase domain
MSEVPREPCPSCGEPAPAVLKACPYCKASLLVDVALGEPVDDPRSRYQLAREIAAFGAPAGDFSTVQQALGAPRPVLARGATRQAAGRLAERLTDFGLRPVLEPAGTTAEPRGRWGGRAAVLGAAVLAAIVVAFLWARPESAGRTWATSPAGTARTQAPAWPTPPPPLAPKDLSQLVRLSLVRFHSGDQEMAGFFVTPELALTRSGADAGGGLLASLADGRVLHGEVVKRDGKLDLALVRIPQARAEPLQLGDASTLRRGATVFYPGPSSGSALRQGSIGDEPREFQGVIFLALDGDLAPADAGGPVLDPRGDVVGMLAVRSEGSFLLPIDYAYLETQLVAVPHLSPNVRKWNELISQVDMVERLRVGPPPSPPAPGAPEGPPP